MTPGTPTIEPVFNDHCMKQVEEAGWRYVRALDIRSNHAGRFAELERVRADGTTSRIVESNGHLEGSLMAAGRLCDASDTPLDETAFVLPFLKGIEELEPHVISNSHHGDRHAQLQMLIGPKRDLAGTRNPWVSIDHSAGDDGATVADDLLRLHRESIEDGETRVRNIIDGPQSIERVSVVVLTNMLGDAGKVADALTGPPPSARLKTLYIDCLGGRWHHSQIENGWNVLGKATVLRNAKTVVNYTDGPLSITGTGVSVRDIALSETILAAISGKPIEDVIDSRILAGGGLTVAKAKNSGGRLTAKGKPGARRIRMTITRDLLTLEEARDLALSMLS